MTKTSECRLAIRVASDRVSIKCLEEGLSLLMQRRDCRFVFHSGDTQLVIEIDSRTAGVDEVLAGFSSALDRVAAACGINPEELELDVTDRDSMEFVQESSSSIVIDGGWTVYLLRDTNAPILHAGSAGKAILIRSGWCFGTGQHPSTRVAARALGFLYRQGATRGARVLDMGTGTGILAIMAALMGAARITALDTDNRCLKTARENVELNRLQDKILMLSTPLHRLQPGKQDIIVANLTLSVILENVDGLVDRLERYGRLILSGHGKTARERITERFGSRGLRLKEVFEEQDWSAEIFGFEE